MKRLIWVSLVLALAACQTTAQPRFLKIEKADSTYSKVNFPFRTDKSGRFNIPIYYKVFDSHGKLGICGYFVNPATGCDENLINAWFDIAYLEVDGKNVGGLSRMEPESPRYSEAGGTATCVEYDTPFRPELESSPMAHFKFKGYQITASCQR